MTTLELVPGVNSRDPWRSFSGTTWRRSIDVADFVHHNVTPYWGQADFLHGPTHRTRDLWAKVVALLGQERSRGILDADPSPPSTITSHAPGSIDRSRELIVGLQTDAPLRRAIMPN